MKTIKDYYTIKLHDTDTAGILFYANQFRIIHDIYEKFLSQIGFDFRGRFERGDFYIPIIHAEADFLQPLKVGDTIEIALNVARVGQTSFTLQYTLVDLDGTAVGTARTVHVTIDPRSLKKIDLPEKFKIKLENALGRNQSSQKTPE
jgi:1,4-dihydroxy-2-naphthoyl-CoA hydrolase